MKRGGPSRRAGSVQSLSLYFCKDNFKQYLSDTPMKTFLLFLPPSHFQLSAVWALLITRVRFNWWKHVAVRGMYPLTFFFLCRLLSHKISIVAKPGTIFPISESHPMLMAKKKKKNSAKLPSWKMTFQQSFVELMKLWLSHFLQSSLTPGITHAMLDLNGFLFLPSLGVFLWKHCCVLWMGSSNP